MRIVLFYHSLLSDWNHGNAHFLRGIAGELIARGHDVAVFEPKNAWSLENLLAEHGEAPLREFRSIYTGLDSTRYDLDTLDLDEVLEGANLVIVHEWNDQRLIGKIGSHRKTSRSYRLLFHDTHHRCVTDPGAIAACDLAHYDGLLAYGSVIRDIYLRNGWIQRAWTWHEAADARIFRPLRGEDDGGLEGDLVWIGNWGDEERTAELQEYMVGPVAELGLKARAHGVRYPGSARKVLSRAGIQYHGWLANYRVPEVFSRFKLTLHIPRRPYTRALPGIPTIRPFEALACGIPLVSSPWEDREGLFNVGKDYLLARSGKEMKSHLSALLHDRELAASLSRNGRRTILERHTCAHRIGELLSIYEELQGGRHFDGGVPKAPEHKEDTRNASRQ
jgi:spore maturation protein CgeB